MTAQGQTLRLAQRGDQEAAEVSNGGPAREELGSAPALPQGFGAQRRKE